MEERKTKCEYIYKKKGNVNEKAGRKKMKNENN